MAEFAQNGAIATLHRLGGDRTAAIEAELERFARDRRIALLLPCHLDELSRPALKTIVNNLRQVRYLDRVVVSLRETPPGALQVAQQFFSSLPQAVTVVWNGPQQQALDRRLRYEGLEAGCRGKGRAFWVGCMYLLARGDCDVIATHDCDITTYSPELLARLCFPLVHPDSEFEFAKGYYARTGGGEMYGRVTRLFLAPLLRAVQTMTGPSQILSYLESFRYPLASEVALTTNLARLTSVPSDGALEIGLLTETFYNCELSGICQTELGPRYDHEHQSLGRDCESGLLKMCVATARSLFETLAAEGLALSARGWRELVTTFRETAAELVARYQADALINGLTFARAREDALVTSFAEALQTAGERHLAGVARPPLLPSWVHLTCTVPSFSEWLLEAVELDSQCGALLPSSV